MTNILKLLLLPMSFIFFDCVFIKQTDFKLKNLQSKFDDGIIIEHVDFWGQGDFKNNGFFQDYTKKASFACTLTCKISEQIEIFIDTLDIISKNDMQNVMNMSSLAIHSLKASSSESETLNKDAHICFSEKNESVIISCDELKISDCNDFILFLGYRVRNDLGEIKYNYKKIRFNGKNKLYFNMKTV